MSFWALATAHTGEVMVNTTVVAAVIKVFGELCARHFPIEAMQVTTPAELTAPPTGDGNNTSACVCRPLAVGPPGRHTPTAGPDLNPVCDPYVKGDLVLPELVSAYLDCANYRPGMVLPPGQGVDHPARWW
jgi:hypothetical protein